jgi:hypothetical protein
MSRLFGEQRQDHELEVLRGQPPCAGEVAAPTAPEEAMPAAAEASTAAVPAHDEMGEMPKMEVFVVSSVVHIVRPFVKYILRYILR